MRRTFIISLVLLLLLAAGLAKPQADTAPEFYPLASSLGWIEGTGRALPQELIGAGIRPPDVVRIGRGYVPRTPPVIILGDSLILKIYTGATGRSLDSGDLPVACRLINFFGVMPWALLLFIAVRRIASMWLSENGAGPIWAAWAAVAGSLAFGWMGAVSPYLPAAALGLLAAACVMEFRRSGKLAPLAAAGICAGLSGAWHPSGWVWIIWGLFYLFISIPESGRKVSHAKSMLIFGVPAVIGAVIAIAGNVLFFGNPLPVQMIDLQPIDLDAGGIIRLLWHDAVGWNGLVWLAPMAVSGAIALFREIGRQTEEHGLSGEMFLLGLVVIALFVWGMVEDARILGEIQRTRPEFTVMPVELADGKFTMVQIGQTSGTPEDRKVFYERVIERTDVFLWNGGRSPGLPVFFPAAVMLALLGWCRPGTSKFINNLNWIAIRWTVLLGLIMSQAPYGALSDAYVYTGFIEAAGQAPIVEAILAVAVRLAELWPSGVVTF